MSNTILEPIGCEVCTDAIHVLAYEGRITRVVCPHLEQRAKVVFCKLLQERTKEARLRGKPLPERETCWVAWEG